MGWDGVLTAAEMIQRGSPRFQQMLRDRKKNKTWMTCQLVIRMPDFMSYLCIILYIYTSSYIYIYSFFQCHLIYYSLQEPKIGLDLLDLYDADCGLAGPSRFTVSEAESGEQQKV